MKKLLGASLLEAGLVNNEQLRLALMDQRKTGQKLGQILINMGFITADILVEFLAKQHGTRGVNLYKEAIDERVQDIVPKQLIEKHQLLPIGFRRVGAINKLVIATPQPLNFELADKLRFASGHEVELVYAREEDLRHFLQYHQYVKKIEIK